MHVLVKEGRLQVPLFHGTSTIFLAEIRQFGLGGKNPITEYRVREFLEEVYRLAESYLAGDEDWQLGRVVIGKMVNQEITAGDFNFRHGAAYLTPSRFTAGCYAARPFGSELISDTLNWFARLEALPDASEAVKPLKNLPLLKLRNTTSEPILIQVNDVPSSILEGERGQSVEEVLQEMEEVFELSSRTGLPPESFWRQCNFALKSPVMADRLEFYRVKFEDPCDLCPKFEYEPFTSTVLN